MGIGLRLGISAFPLPKYPDLLNLQSSLRNLQSCIWNLECPGPPDRGSGSKSDSKTKSNRYSARYSDRNFKKYSKRNSKRESDRDSKRGSERNSKKDSARNSKRYSDRNSYRDSDRESDRNSKRYSDRDSDRDSNKDSFRYSDIESFRYSIIESVTACFPHVSRALKPASACARETSRGRLCARPDLCPAGDCPRMGTVPVALTASPRPSSRLGNPACRGDRSRPRAAPACHGVTRVVCADAPA